MRAWPDGRTAFNTSFRYWLKFQRTRCNLDVGSGFCGFCDSLLPDHDLATIESSRESPGPDQFGNVPVSRVRIFAVPRKTHSTCSADGARIQPAPPDLAAASTRSSATASGEETVEQVRHADRFGHPSHVGDVERWAMQSHKPGDIVPLPL